MRVPSAAHGFPSSGVVDGEWLLTDRGTEPYDLMTGAGVLGARVWVEQEMHRIAGSWSTSAARPVLAVAFDRVAMHHAARAEVLFDRLPQLRELPSDSVVVPGGPATVGLIDAVKGTVGDGTDDRRAAVWLAIADGLLVAYRDHLRRASVVADASLLRRLPSLIAGLELDVADLTAAVGSVPDMAGPEAEPAISDLVDLTSGFME